MNDSQEDIDWFWNIIEKAIPPLDNYNPEMHIKLLRTSLYALPESELFKFDRIFKKMVNRAYTEDLWNAGTVIANGMGDDSFSDFRSAIVAFGKTVFETIIANPNSLGNFSQTGYLVNNPDFYNPIHFILADRHGSDYAVENVHSEELPDIDFEKLSDEPEVLKAQFPELFAKYWTGEFE